MVWILRVMGIGLFSTLIMVLFLRILRLFGLAEVDVFRALGSLVTKTYRNSLVPGLIMLFTGGALFSLIYSYVIKYAPVQTEPGVILTGAALGFVHGLTITFLLVVMVAEYHPLESFRQRNVSVIISYLFGHVIYGLSVGFLLSSKYLAILSKF